MTFGFPIDAAIEAIRAEEADFLLNDAWDDVNYPDMDCDWEEAECPMCGRAQDAHDSRMMTRCAMAQFNSWSR